MGLLIGSAGTGKSYTVSRIVHSLQEEWDYCAIAMSAPTHKAVKVLRKDALPRVDYATIHSLLGLKESVDHNTGKVSYTADASLKGQDPRIAEYNVLILDEVSMLGRELFNYLAPWIKKGLKVIFCGDKVQIPPVGEIESFVLLKAEEYNMVRCELTQVMRQKDGNPILELATAIRDDYKQGSFEPHSQLNELGHGIEVIEPMSPREEDILKEYFDCQAFKDDPDYMKVVAWRNTIVDSYNRRIRQYIYKQPILPNLMVGEKLVMDAPVIDSMKRVLLSTNEEITVKSLIKTMKSITTHDPYGVRTSTSFAIYRAHVEWLVWKMVNGKMQQTPRATMLDIIHDESQQALEKHIKSLREVALKSPSAQRGTMWRQYFSTIEQFAWVKYNYAITAHKSQGSSYDNCLVLKGDIDINRNIEERNRILYVACSRARNTLFIEV